MITQQILIGNIPSILWGNDSSRLYLYVHGQGGNKEEASFLAEKICVRGWQVLSFDLPGHGERKDENGSFDAVRPCACHYPDGLYIQSAAAHYWGIGRKENG